MATPTVTLRALKAFGFGNVTGAASRILRPHFVGSIHWDAVAAFALLALAVLLIVWLHRNDRSRLDGHVSLQVSVCALWLGFVALWSIVHGRVWPEMAAVSSGWWLASAGTAGILLLCLQAFLRARRTGAEPACPACGYILIGLTSRRCPECGRPFTEAELVPEGP